MRILSNLQDFLQTTPATHGYRYRISRTGHLNALLRKRVYDEYVNGVVLRLKGVHDTICQQAKAEPLPSEVWSNIQERLMQRTLCLKDPESLAVSSIYEIDPENSVSMELITTIV